MYSQIPRSKLRVFGPCGSRQMDMLAYPLGFVARRNKQYTTINFVIKILILCFLYFINIIQNVSINIFIFLLC